MDTIVPSMTLNEWLRASTTKDKDFAKLIGVSRVTLFRLKTGRRRPDSALMEKIFNATSGAVTPNDIFGIGQPSQTTEAA